MDRDHCGREEEHRDRRCCLGGLLLLPEGICFRCCCRPLGWRLPFYKHGCHICSRSSSTLFFSFGFSFLFSLVTSSLSFSVDPLHFCTHDMLQGLRLSCWPPWLAQVVQHCKPNWVGHRTPSHWPPHALCFGSRANCS
jgi:hypothetical protein